MSRDDAVYNVQRSFFLGADYRHSYSRVNTQCFSKLELDSKRALDSGLRG